MRWDRRSPQNCALRTCRALLAWRVWQARRRSGDRGRGRSRQSRPYRRSTARRGWSARLRLRTRSERARRARCRDRQPIDTDVVDLLDSAATRGWATTSRRGRRSSRRARPPRRRLARWNADRGGSARGLGLPGRAPRSNRPARDPGVRAAPHGERPRPLRPDLGRAGAGADAPERRLCRGEGGVGGVDARARGPLQGDWRDGEHRRRRRDRHTTDARREPRQGLLDVHAGGGDRRQRSPISAPTPRHR